eukprot:12821298-Alexandrium_andersonii.AAC.1
MPPPPVRSRCSEVRADGCEIPLDEDGNPIEVVSPKSMPGGRAVPKTVGRQTEAGAVPPWRAKPNAVRLKPSPPAYPPPK